MRSVGLVPFLILLVELGEKEVFVSVFIILKMLRSWILEVVGNRHLRKLGGARAVLINALEQHFIRTLWFPFKVRGDNRKSASYQHQSKWLSATSPVPNRNAIRAFADSPSKWMLFSFTEAKLMQSFVRFGFITAISLSQTDA